MLQEEFNELYDRLRTFALHRARLYFKDNSLCQDAADDAVNKFVDALIISPDIKDIGAWAKTIITNSLKDSSKKKRELEPIDLEGEEYKGMHGYKEV